MSGRLPLFPLDLVLFPGELVPLHIFEPRYRQLLADCLAGDRRFGITKADPPAAGALGTVALIRRTEPLADGRSNIIVLGGRRFSILTLLDTDTPYRVATVGEFTDLPDTAPLPGEATELELLADRVRRALATLGDSEADAGWDDDPEARTFQVAALLESDPACRAPLLAERRTRQRVRALIGLLPPRLHSLEARAEIHLRARSNGKGHIGHDVGTE